MIFDDIQTILEETTRAWAWSHLMPQAALRDEKAEFDAALYRRLDTELGLMNATLPPEFGGAGYDISAPIIAIESLSECDPGIAISYLSQELLFTHQLYYTWQADHSSLPTRHADILKKKSIAGMAMTEPNAGTDVLGMRTTAERVADGFLLNGTKQWITNAPVAEVFLVYARTGENRKDISLFLVERHTPGLEIKDCDAKMGMRSSPTGILMFTDCLIPHDAVVGTLHEGLKPMIRNLAVERLGLAAQSCGIARTCLATAKKYAAERMAFGRSIAEFGQIQKFIAESFAKYQAMRSFLYDCVRDTIQKAPDASVKADAVKLFCASAAEEIGRNAIQVLGANGYSNAYPVSRLYRDAVLLSIGGGTNEALQKNITRLLCRDA